MKPTEFHRYWILDERTGKRRKTSYKLTREDAARQFPGSEPVEGTLEIRNLPESPESARPICPSVTPHVRDDACATADPQFPVSFDVDRSQ